MFNKPSVLQHFICNISAKSTIRLQFIPNFDDYGINEKNSDESSLSDSLYKCLAAPIIRTDCDFVINSSDTLLPESLIAPLQIRVRVDRLLLPFSRSDLRSEEHKAALDRFRPKPFPDLGPGFRSAGYCDRLSSL